MRADYSTAISQAVLALGKQFPAQADTLTTTDAGGGALYNDGTLVVANSTLSGNDAATTGAGLLNVGSATASIVNTTIFENAATDGIGGVDNQGSSATLSNAIVANTTATGADCGGTITTSGPNIDFDGTCSASIQGDPQLGALTDNGGPTDTHLPQSGSPAIDAGDDTICSNSPISNIDQRLRERPFGANCDIGAVEAGLTVTPTSISLASASAERGNSSLLLIAITLFAGLMTTTVYRKQRD